MLDKINGKIGWKKIKEAVKDLVMVCGTNYQRELDGQAPLPVFLNRLFLGNPGTGQVRNPAVLQASHERERETPGKLGFGWSDICSFAHKSGKMTGKTTCAKLYGEVLKHLGFLSSGEVVLKTAGDLGGSVVGEAQQKVLNVLQ